MKVRTRFAPSPTGELHIGGVRTAIFAWLLAQHSGGQFVLRIEDTDQQRSVPGAVAQIVKGLDWFGITPDEGPSASDLAVIEELPEGYREPSSPFGPYIQSLRKERYAEAAQQLIASGHAFRCDCTAEQLAADRDAQQQRGETPGYSGRCRDRDVSADSRHVVRFRMPEAKSVVLQDAVKGAVEWESVPLRDPVLVKSDGFATYHLASVVDDHHMEISHVLRGDEWLSSAPLHVLLYEAFGWEQPVFAHLPVVLGPDKKKLSKRHGATALKQFADEGYLPEALMNYVALVGWSAGEGGDQQIFSRAELIEKFSLDRVNRASGIFDFDKLRWMNGVYIRQLPVEEFLARAKPFIESAGLPYREERILPVASHVQERSKLLADVAQQVDFLLHEKITRDTEAMFKKKVTPSIAKTILEEALGRLRGLEQFDSESLEGTMRDIAEAQELKPGPAFGVIRVAVTGKSVTPPLFESMQALGREKVLERLEQALGEVEAILADA